MTMTPDYDAAAIKAYETLIKYHITAAPIMPMPILKSMPRTLVLPFAELAIKLGVDREHIVSTFGSENSDIVTSVSTDDGELRYVITYNQRMPFYMLQRSLARELGHIILKHDGSKPDEVRKEEAWCFAHHLLCPRPLIKAIQDSGIPLTVETFGNITGCYERCLISIRKTPGAHVPASLNRIIREQFSDYISNLIDCKSIMIGEDETGLANLGTYMDNYEE